MESDQKCVATLCLTPGEVVLAAAMKRQFAMFIVAASRSSAWRKTESSGIRNQTAIAVAMMVTAAGGMMRRARRA